MCCLQWNQVYTTLVVMQSIHLVRTVSYDRYILRHSFIRVAAVIRQFDYEEASRREEKSFGTREGRILIGAH